MKFAILTQCYPPEVGGAQVFASSLVNELTKLGHDVRVITAMPSRPYGRIYPGYRGHLFMKEDFEGTLVFRVWAFPSLSASMIPRLTSYFTFCFNALFAARWMGKPDLLFVDSPPLFDGLTARALSAMRGVPYLFCVSDLWPDVAIDAGIVKAPGLVRALHGLESYIYRHASIVSTVTRAIQKTLVTEKNLSENKVIFLPIGVDVKLFQPRTPDPALLAQYNLTGKKVFICAGTIGHFQGVEVLLHAATLLKNRTDISIAIIGEGPRLAFLKSLAAEKSISNVTFIDPQPLKKMPEWWAVAYGALATLSDHKINETARPTRTFPPMACGKPVIFSGSGEMAGLIQEAKAGLAVPPADPQAVANAILKLADDPEYARTCGENGMIYARNHLSWPSIVKKWLEELQAKMPSLPRS